MKFVQLALILGWAFYSLVSLADTQDACDAIAGKIFVSVHRLPMGENAHGTVFGNWRLSFQNNMSASWRLHDYTDNGIYSCEGLTVKVVFAPGTPAELYGTGTLNVSTGQLVFENEPYAAAD